MSRSLCVALLPLIFIVDVSVACQFLSLVYKIKVGS